MTKFRPGDKVIGFMERDGRMEGVRKRKTPTVRAIGLQSGVGVEKVNTRKSLNI